MQIEIMVICDESEDSEAIKAAVAARIAEKMQEMIPSPAAQPQKA